MGFNLGPTYVTYSLLTSVYWHFNLLLVHMAAKYHFIALASTGRCYARSIMHFLKKSRKGAVTHPKRAVKFGRKGREGLLGLGNPAGLTQHVNRRARR